MADQVMLDPDLLARVQKEVGERAQAIANAIQTAGVPNDDLTIVALGAMVQSRLVTHQIYVTIDRAAQEGGAKRE